MSILPTYFSRLQNSVSLKVRCELLTSLRAQLGNSLKNDNNPTAQTKSQILHFVRYLCDLGRTCDKEDFLLRMQILNVLEHFPYFCFLTWEYNVPSFLCVCLKDENFSLRFSAVKLVYHHIAKSKNEHVRVATNVLTRLFSIFVSLLSDKTSLSSTQAANYFLFVTSSLANFVEFDEVKLFLQLQSTDLFQLLVAGVVKWLIGDMIPSVRDGILVPPNTPTDTQLVASLEEIETRERNKQLLITLLHIIDRLSSSHLLRHSLGQSLCLSHALLWHATHSLQPQHLVFVLNTISNLNASVSPLFLQLLFRNCDVNNLDNVNINYTIQEYDDPLIFAKYQLAFDSSRSTSLTFHASQTAKLETVHAISDKMWRNIRSNFFKSLIHHFPILYDYDVPSLGMSGVDLFVRVLLVFCQSETTILRMFQARTMPVLYHILFRPKRPVLASTQVFATIPYLHFLLSNKSNQIDANQAILLTKYVKQMVNIVVGIAMHEQSTTNNTLNSDNGNNDNNINNNNILDKSKFLRFLPMLLHILSRLVRGHSKFMPDGITKNPEFCCFLNINNADNTTLNSGADDEIVSCSWLKPKLLVSCLHLLSHMTMETSCDKPISVQSEEVPESRFKITEDGYGTATDMQLLEDIVIILTFSPLRLLEEACLVDPTDRTNASSITTKRAKTVSYFKEHYPGTYNEQLTLIEVFLNILLPKSRHTKCDLEQMKNILYKLPLKNRQMYSLWKHRVLLKVKEIDSFMWYTLTRLGDNGFNSMWTIHKIQQLKEEYNNDIEKYLSLWRHCLPMKIFTRSKNIPKNHKRTFSQTTTSSKTEKQVKLKRRSHKYEDDDSNYSSEAMDSEGSESDDKEVDSDRKSDNRNNECEEKECFSPIFEFEFSDNDWFQFLWHIQTLNLQQDTMSTKDSTNDNTNTRESMLSEIDSGDSERKRENDTGDNVQVSIENLVSHGEGRYFHVANEKREKDNFEKEKLMQILLTHFN